MIHSTPSASASPLSGATQDTPSCREAAHRLDYPTRVPASRFDSGEQMLRIDRVCPPIVRLSETDDVARDIYIYIYVCVCVHT